MIKVDGVEIPTPSEYNPYPELREKSSENSLGDVKRKIISCRWKLEMKWDLLTKEQYAQLIKIKFKKSFQCEFPSSTGKRVTKTMYAGDPKGNAFKLDKKTDTVKNWTSVSLNFIQLKADKYTGGAY
jgi:hypothetical protein